MITSSPDLYAVVELRSEVAWEERNPALMQNRKRINVVATREHCHRVPNLEFLAS